MTFVASFLLLVFELYAFYTFHQISTLTGHFDTFWRLEAGAPEPVAFCAWSQEHLPRNRGQD